MSSTVHWVLPAFNESASIADLLDRIADVSEEAGWSYDILVVDDGSSDGTGAIAVAKAADGLPVRVLTNTPNQGLGRTLRRGLTAAAEEAAPDDVIITLDADLTQDPAYAPSMVERIDRGFDVVIASRYRSGSAVEGLSTLRRLLSYGASALFVLLRPVRGVRDYSCGFRAYRADVLQRALAIYGDDFVKQEGFACTVEIAARLRDIASFDEVPFVLRYGDKRKPSAIRIMPTIKAYFRVIADVAAQGRKPVPISTLVMALCSVFLGALGQVFLRLGAQELTGLQARQLLIDAAQRPEIAIGLLLYSLSSVLWLGILTRMDLSVAYPLGASGYVLVVVLAALGGEAVPPMRWVGVLVIIAGVLLVGWLGAAPTVRPRRT